MKTHPGGLVLVTGASGLLGSALVRHLQNEGRLVLTVGRRDPGLGTEHFQADLTDREAVAAVFSAHPIHAVLHMAAVIPGAGDDFSANGRMTQNLLQEAAKAGVRRFISASSVALYGLCTEPSDESAPLQVSGAYAESKWEAEKSVSEAHDAQGLQTCSLRISAPYGGKPTVPTVVNKFLSQAATGQPITLFGSGSRQQHFVHESDVARAFVLAMDSEADGIFNISGPAPVSMATLAGLCVEILAKGSSVTLTGTDAQEHYRGHFPWKKAHAAFGYQPQTDLPEGLRQTACDMGLL